MKKSLYPLLLLLVLASCYSGPRGELVGVQPREDWVQVNPYGMNYIHYGSYTMGPNDQDVPYAIDARSKTVTIPAFYMDIHEISNNEYRQFVYYVRDSLYRDVLAQNDIEGFMYEETADGKEVDRFVNKGYVLLWEEEIDWEDEEIFDLLYDEFWLQGSDRFKDIPQLDSRKLNFRYYWIDYQGAARKAGKDEEYSETNSLNQLHSVRGHSDRSQFIIEETINVYPDTLCWVHDFTYSYNDPLVNYFWHPSYDDYPVVGVTWGQAKAFTHWRTQILNEWKRFNGETIVQDFRLPTEAEWEFASRGGLELNYFPWGGPYIRNVQGCPLANFKPMRGDYVEDGGAYTVPIESYSPNDYGLYQMAGNVAEWTSTAYDEGVYDFSWDMSPEYQYHAKVDDPPSLKRKVVRGGSWKDIGYYCQNGTRNYEYSDTAKSYIGFRCVMSYLGRGKAVDPSDFN
ncbi:MAG: SUMF1/EgtB/PvdO family nonheme iron enzyme [Flavobacteriales bacterium]|nr:SUMF1/EgtB/PvdO family nonheme iron enzyme [Flavobacteriales bacterium]